MDFSHKSRYNRCISEVYPPLRGKKTGRMIKRMKYIKKGLAAVLAAVMLLSFTGCNTSWVFDYDGTKIPAGLYIGYTIAAYGNLSSQEGYSDTITDPMKQTVNGMSAKEWIKQDARSSCNAYIAVERKFEELGLTLSEDEMATIDSNTEAAWEAQIDANGTTLGELYEDNGVSKETYRKMLISSSKLNSIFQKYYGEGGLQEIPVENLTAHFEENYASINALSIVITEGDNLTDAQIEANEERQEKMDTYLKWINEEGKSFSECYDDYYHFLTQTEHTDTEDVQTDEDLKTWLTKDTTSVSSVLMNAVFNEMKDDGTARIVNDGTSNYLVVRYDVNSDEKNFEEMRESVLVNLKSDEFNDMVAEWADALEPTVNQAAVNRYDPKNIHSAL